MDIHISVAICHFHLVIAEANLNRQTHDQGSAVLQTAPPIMTKNLHTTLSSCHFHPVEMMAGFEPSNLGS